MFKKTKFIICSLFLLVSISILSGCNLEEASESVKKDKTVETYDLVWFDYLNASSTDSAPPVKVAYMEKHKEKTKTFEKYTENVEDIEKPYIKIVNDKVYIYRPPYLKYIQDPVEGKVKDKKIQQGSDRK
ncbi:hypothetical protein [Bacillus amyloliquefaciens]|uniref:hypothetical protein n=1 Tax=Bacillus amyloliquefaciens TaxID=1390 RepID=UPI0032DEAE28